MRWKRLERLRLAQALLLLLLPALLALSLVELRVAAHEVHRAADAAYDRSLLGALKAIDASVSTESGGLAVELPYRLFEFFELSASGPVHYRVASADGLVELGSADLPAPPAPLRLGSPQFYDGRYFGEPVRVVAYLRELARPADGSRARQLVIQVAESTRSRAAFSRGLLRRALLENLLFLALTAACAVAAVLLVLRPLAGLSARLAARPASDLSPIADADLPADIRPLVGAMNQHMRRIEELGRQQRAFVDDASHQLRTHLTTLRMQVDFALREPDEAQVREALAALRTELQRASRSTHQLLSLARSDAAPLELAPFDLRELLQDLAREFLPQARARGLDLGVEGESHRALGDAGLLREALGNLLANALACTPQGSVTLRAAADRMGWALAVEDTGPGMPAQLRAAAGQRFVRSPRRSEGGAGLGLAIASGIAARHAGVLRLEPGEDGRGLHATLWWPRPQGETTP